MEPDRSWGASLEASSEAAWLLSPAVSEELSADWLWAAVVDSAELL